MSGLVYISGSDWKAWQEAMQRLEATFGLAADKTLAYIGAEGRREIGEQEKQAGFDFGVKQTKWKHGRMESAVRSRMYGSHGWYKTSDGQRMIGFSFENALTYQKRKAKLMRNQNGISQGYVYSLMANLWNNPTKPYSKNSPGFRREGFMRNGKPRMGGWGRGSQRPARPALASSVVERGLGKAMRRAESALQRMILEEGF